MTGVLVRKDPKTTWYSAGAFKFRLAEVYWIYENYEQLAQGYWPRKITGYIDNQFVKAPRHFAGAYFLDPAGILAEFHWRLDRCGDDGILVKCYKCFGWDLEHLKTIAKINQERLDEITARVSGYISGRRKSRTYEQFCRHW